MDIRIDLAVTLRYVDHSRASQIGYARVKGARVGSIGSDSTRVVENQNVVSWGYMIEMEPLVAFTILPPPPLLLLLRVNILGEQLNCTRSKASIGWNKMARDAGLRQGFNVMLIAASRRQGDGRWRIGQDCLSNGQIVRQIGRDFIDSLWQIVKSITA